MHTTVNGTETTDATAYHEPALGKPEVRLDAVLRRAERLVAGLAPAPSNPDGDYGLAAADAELAVFAFLWDSPPHLARHRVDDVDVTYRGREGVADLVRESMGRFYVGWPSEAAEAVSSRSSGGATVRNVSPEPLWDSSW